MVRVLLGCLLVLFTGLQYKLWVSPHGYAQLHEVKQQLASQTQQNGQLLADNQQLRHDVAQLKSQSLSAVEDYARREFGLIKPDEVFYQLS